jgi:hypothetical protein
MPVPETSESAIIDSMPSDPKKQIVPAPVVEPPKIYIPACGTLCDIFWWARRNPPAEEQAASPLKDETP